MPLYEGLTRGVMMSTAFASMGALMFGIDNGWWGTALGLPRFNQEFGTLVTVDPTTGISTNSLTASEQSAGTGLGQAGVMIGCALSTPINRYYGRRAGVAIMGVIAIVGIIVQITASVNGYRYWQLVAGKLINSISMGIACNVVPTYQSELAPAKWRGAIINLYQAVQIIGVVIATAVVYSLSTKDSVMAWQIPVGLQFVAPAILLAGVAWMPESPRWLVWQGRTDEARDVLHKLHGEDPNYSATAEVELLVAAFDEEKAIRAPSLMDVFRGTDLRRTMISVGVQCLQQAQGSSYMTSYIVLFLISLGMTNVFQVVMILYCLYLSAILCSFILPDYLGRRPMLIWGAVVCASCLTIVSGLNIGISPATNASQKAGLAMIFIWYFTFGLVWSPLTWITSTEVCSARVREPTLTLATFSGFGVGLIITLVSPYIQDAQYGNLGGSIGFIWAAFTWISIPFVWFLIPEFKGLSLERIDYLFEHRVATRQFQSYQGGSDEENVPTVSHSGSFDKAEADK